MKALLGKALVEHVESALGLHSYPPIQSDGSTLVPDPVGKAALLTVSIENPLIWVCFRVQIFLELAESALVMFQIFLHRLFLSAWWISFKGGDTRVICACIWCPV